MNVEKFTINPKAGALDQSPGDKKEVKMKIKFSDEGLVSFDTHKQQQVVHALEGIISEKALRISKEQGDFEVGSGKLRAVISKIALEEHTAEDTVVTPKLKCSHGTYPCVLRMTPGVTPVSGANTAIIADIVVQSQKSVVTTVASLLEAPQFPSGLQVTNTL